MGKGGLTEVQASKSAAKFWDLVNDGMSQGDAAADVIETMGYDPEDDDNVRTAMSGFGLGARRVKLGSKDTEEEDVVEERKPRSGDFKSGNAGGPGRPSGSSLKLHGLISTGGQRKFEGAEAEMLEKARSAANAKLGLIQGARNDPIQVRNLANKAISRARDAAEPYIRTLPEREQHSARVRVEREVDSWVKREAGDNYRERAEVFEGASQKEGGSSPSSSKVADKELPYYAGLRKKAEKKGLFDGFLRRERKANVEAREEQVGRARMAAKKAKVIAQKAASKSTYQFDQNVTRATRRAGPVGAFFGSMRLLNRQARIVATASLIIGILFVPVGIFTFSGWAIVAVAMTIISAFYFVIVNIFKLIAGLAVSAINAVFAFLAAIVVKVVEAILSVIDGLGGNPNQGITECTGIKGNVPVKSNFCSGREILADGLIPASELKAMSISLLDPEKLKPKMDTKPLIQWVGEQTGLFKVDFGGFFSNLMGPSFQRWVQEGNIYQVMAVFLIPVVVLGVLAYYKMVKPGLVAGGLRRGA